MVSQRGSPQAYSYCLASVGVHFHSYGLGLSSCEWKKNEIEEKSQKIIRNNFLD